MRPIICSVSSGVISIWAQNQVENWSAFAPDFTELDENVEYVERESEFDESDEDKSIPPKEDELYQDIEVDVEKIDRVEAFCSSDEDDQEGIFHFILHLLNCEHTCNGYGNQKQSLTNSMSIRLSLSFIKIAIVSFCLSPLK